MAVAAAEHARRLNAKLAFEFGELLKTLMLDPAVEDIHRNEDGSVFVTARGAETRRVGHMDDNAALSAICTIASQRGMLFNRQNPVLETTLLDSNARFTAVGEPLVGSPIFSIRKPSIRVPTLRSYVDGGCMSEEQYQTIFTAVKRQDNILIAGATGSGKTTFANSLLSEIAATSPTDRLVIIEDTREIHSPIANTVQILSGDGGSALECLKVSLRLRPNRIIVGEVRGGEAHAMLKAWNTGHPGSIATIHANSAGEALQRLEELVAEAPEAGLRPMQQLIARAVWMVVFLCEDRTVSAGRRIREMATVNGWNDGEYLLEPI